ncbi:phage tail protein [Leeuwenhoekiella aestuarii]|uniref:Tail protein (Putative endopeptidase) n=1 Tax=Leeuwenhoekiella aestuarii TaxID=2249426 RepID=A0A4Q0NSJ4_9FLAO|nr:phage tail protein [Leeuwenhoekiella aestuarii]RXG13968.1 tail protein (putative endopeptidase) [Leeuwenhoekiella aestuarii]
MRIFRYIDEVKTQINNIEIDGQTELLQKIGGEDVVTSRFTIEGRKLDLQIGDFIEFKDSDYTILDEPQVKKAQNTFSYNLQFKSDMYILKNVQVMLDDESEFYLFGDPIDAVSLIISNLNRVYGAGVYFADYVEPLEGKNLNFTNENCLAALQKLAAEFECEFQVKGKQITFRKNIGSETNIKFEYKKGLRDIERLTLQNAELVTVLYPTGSIRNITNEYGSKRLKIPKLENNVDVFGTIERSVTFEDVYPRLKGVVSSSSSITKFRDTAIDFNINEQLIGGAKAKVIFNTGDLAGREFEIASYNNSNKEIEIIPYTDETDYISPNETFRPRSGDKYVLVNIKMPQAYIDNAEEELLERATEYLEKYSQPNVIYKVSPHYPYLRRNQTELNIGDIITITDEDFGIDFQVRILSLSQKLNNPYQYSLEIGSQVTISYITSVLLDQRNIKNTIYQNEKYVSEQFNRVFNNIGNFKAPLYVNMGEFDPETLYHNSQNRVDYIFKFNNEGVKEWFTYIGEDNQAAEFILANWQFIDDNFEIIATNTLLAENANIGDWLIQNGQIVSQAIYESEDPLQVEPRVILDSINGNIRLNTKLNIEGSAGIRPYKQRISLSSTDGSILCIREGDTFQEQASASINSYGVVANFPGIDISLFTQSNIKGKTGMLGIGYSNLPKINIRNIEFIAGVFGIAKNENIDPVEAYGGYFFDLKTQGRFKGIKRLVNSDDYTISQYDEYISCYNDAAINIYLPDPTTHPEGRVITIKRMDGVINVTGQIFTNQNVASIGLNIGERWTFINDGVYWHANKSIF